MRDRRPSPGLFRSKPASARRWGALLLAGCVFAALMLAAGSLSAQKVLLSPEINMEFDRLTVEGTSDSLQVGYELREVDWQWARDYDLDMWVALYTPQSEGNWRLERAAALDERSGEVEITVGLSPNAERVGVCLVAATEGGQLAPGMGYRCEEPVEVAVEDGRLDLQTDSATVALRLEQSIDEASWFRPELGFETAMAGAEARDGGDGEQDGFFVYEQPSASDAQAQQGKSRQRGRSRQRGLSGQRSGDEMPRIVIRGDTLGGDSGYGQRQMLIYVPGFLPSTRFDRSVRDDIDRFRQRRLERRRVFGPLDPFDAHFDQDMFSEHPEDVFHRFRIPPGHFGRDGFGRPLREAVPVRPGAQPGDPVIDVTP